MTATERFFAHALAFEKAVKDDDWSALEPFFHEDAVYEVWLGPPLGGRFRRLEDRYEPAMEKELQTCIAAHGRKLGLG
jgi:hypothetical protein